MIWVQNGLITILTTLIIHSHNVGFANLEMTWLSLDPRKIGYYTPYNRQVLPRHRNTVRMNSKLTVEEDSQWKMFYQHG
jgi:hypothetical protein